MKKIDITMIAGILLLYFTITVTSESDQAQGNPAQDYTFSTHLTSIDGSSIDASAKEIEKKFTNELLEKNNAPKKCFMTVNNFFKKNSQLISNFLTAIEKKVTPDTRIHYDHSCAYAIQRLERRIETHDFSTPKFIIDLGRVLVTLSILSDRTAITVNQKKALSSMSTYFELVALGHQKKYFSSVTDEYEVQQLVPVYSQEVTQMIEQRKGICPTNRNPFISPLKKIQKVLLSLSNDNERSTNYTTRFHLLNDAIRQLRDLKEHKEFNSSFIEELLYGIEHLFPLIKIMDVYKKHSVIFSSIQPYNTRMKQRNTLKEDKKSKHSFSTLLKATDDITDHQESSLWDKVKKKFTSLKMAWIMKKIQTAISNEYVSKNNYSPLKKPETIFENMNKFLEHHQKSITDYLTFEKIYSHDLSTLYAYQPATAFQKLVQTSKCNDFPHSTFIVTMGKLIFSLFNPLFSLLNPLIAIYNKENVVNMQSYAKANELSLLLCTYFCMAAVGHRRKYFPKIANEHEIKKIIPIYSQSLTQMIEEGKELYQRDKNSLFSSINALRKVLLSFSPNNSTLSYRFRAQLLNDAMRQLHELKQFKEFNSNFINELLAGIPTLIAMTMMVAVYKQYDTLFTNSLHSHKNHLEEMVEDDHPIEIFEVKKQKAAI